MTVWVSTSMDLFQTVDGILVALSIHFVDND